MIESTRSMDAAAVKHEEEGGTNDLDFVSLLIIRLDEFNQDELRLLAQYSGDFPEARFQNIVIPEIDRRIFNESAGSRRQTYGKCFASRHWNTVPDDADDTGNEEDSEPASSRGRRRLHRKQKQQPKASVAEKTRSAKAVARVIVERKGRLRLRDTANQGRNEARGQSGVGRKVSWTRRKSPPSASSDSSGDSKWSDSSEKGARATGSLKRGRPKKLAASNEVTNEGLTDRCRKKQKQDIAPLMGAEYEEELGRRRKRRANYSQCGSGVVEGRGSKRRDERRTVLGRHGEIDHKIEGARKYFGEEELMERLTKMEGKWSSSQMKRKIVDAAGFPKGWTVLVGLRRTKDGCAYFDYRDWRSPEGRIWTSYREAAAYLVSTVGKDSCFKGLPHSLADQEDDPCEQNALTAFGETSHEALCSDRDQTFNNFSAPAELLNSQEAQLFFETQTEGDLQSLERSFQQDLQGPERGAFEDSNSQSSGDNVDQHLNDVDAACGCLQTANVERQHVCDLCGMSFPTLKKLRRHLRRSKHLKYLKCAVCGKKFTSITLLLGHRLKMGHARTSRINLEHSRLPAEVSDSVENPRQSEMSNIVLGLLSDVHRSNRGLESVQPSVLKQSINRTTDIGTGAGKSVPHMLESVKGDVGEEVPSEMPNTVFECETCHKIFTHQSKFWGHLSIHSSKKGGTGLAAAKSSEGPRIEPVADGVYECEICHKVFHHQSKYWGHLSIHSSKRKKGLTSYTLHDSESERLGSRMVEEVKPSVRQLVNGSKGVEVNHTTCVTQHVTKSVFWKLLDDSIPPEGANLEPVTYREEATIRPLASCTKEEAASNEGNIGFRAPPDVNVGPTSGLPRAKSSPAVLSIHSDSLFDHGLLEQKVGETRKIINDVFVGIETVRKQL